MIRSMAKILAYSKAPKATFAVMHPRKTMRLRALKRDLRRSPAPRVAAVGVAALALPLGIALGRISAGRADRLA